MRNAAEAVNIIKMEERLKAAISEMEKEMWQEARPHHALKLFDVFEREMSICRGVLESVKEFMEDDKT